MKCSDFERLVDGVYLFHAFPGSRATLEGGLKTMSYASGAMVVKLAGQCWLNSSLMGVLEHVYDRHYSAIVGKMGLSIAVIGPCDTGSVSVTQVQSGCIPTKKSTKLNS